MKKITILYICLAVAWFVLATVSAVMAFMGVQVDAIVAFCPSILCSCLYLDKIVQLHRKEK
jgi:hypothetical protein